MSESGVIDTRTSSCLLSCVRETPKKSSTGSVPTERRGLCVRVGAGDVMVKEEGSGDCEPEMVWVWASRSTALEPEAEGAAVCHEPKTV